MAELDEYNDLTGDARTTMIDYWETRCSDEDAVVLVAVEDDTLVAYASARQRDTSAEFRRGADLYVENTYVREDARQQGIGSALLDAMETKAKRLGCETMSLQVHVDNHGANERYERHGLEKKRYLRTKPIG